MLTIEFNRGGNPSCTIDDLNVRWRVARLAELAGVISGRRAFNTAIATLAARALRYGQPGGVKRPGLTESDIDAIARNHVKDSQDEQDFRACLHMATGDEEFWHGQYKKAAQAYCPPVQPPPWPIRARAKYLLLPARRSRPSPPP